MSTGLGRPDDPIARLVRRFQLEPHPEGGFYREIHRSTILVDPRDGRPGRCALTAIYYLLPGGQHSRWHRVASDEVWHLYDGGPLELWLAPPGLATVERVRLGSTASGSDPAATVPAGWWQAARALGGHALAGCTVAPGFEFEDFGFLSDHPDLLERLRVLSPELAGLA